MVFQYLNFTFRYKVVDFNNIQQLCFRCKLEMLQSTYIELLCGEENLQLFGKTKDYSEL